MLDEIMQFCSPLLRLSRPLLHFSFYVLQWYQHISLRSHLLAPFVMSFQTVEFHSYFVIVNTNYDDNFEPLCNVILELSTYTHWFLLHIFFLNLTLNLRNLSFSFCITIILHFQPENVPQPFQWSSKLFIFVMESICFLRTIVLLPTNFLHLLPHHTDIRLLQNCLDIFGSSCENNENVFKFFELLWNQWISLIPALNRQ